MGKAWQVNGGFERGDSVLTEEFCIFYSHLKKILKENSEVSKSFGELNVNLSHASLPLFLMRQVCRFSHTANSEELLISPSC